MKVIKFFMFCFIIFHKSISAQINIEDTEPCIKRLMFLLNKNDLNLNGEVSSCFIEKDTTFIFGNFLTLENSQNQKITISTYKLNEFINLDIKESFIELNYYAIFNNNPSTKALEKYCTKVYDLNSLDLVYQNYFYNYDTYSLRLKQLKLIRKRIGNCLHKTKELLKSIHDPEFMSLVFYGAMMGDAKCQYFFDNAFFIAIKKSDSSEIEGIDIKVYLDLQLIYKEFKQNRMVIFR